MVGENRAGPRWHVAALKVAALRLNLLAFGRIIRSASSLDETSTQPEAAKKEHQLATETRRHRDQQRAEGDTRHELEKRFRLNFW